MEIFDYDNILLLPRKCRVESRSECDPSIEFGGRRFKLPVVPANMKTVLDESISEWLAANGYFYVMHRFDLDNVAYAKRMREKGLFVSISSGVKAPDYEVIDRLAADGVGADYITIDIAHGHAESVRLMIEHIKKKLPKAFVIAGNVATPEAVIDLEELGRRTRPRWASARARSASPSSRPGLAPAAGSSRRSSGARAWPPNPSSRTAASAITDCP